MHQLVGELTIALFSITIALTSWVACHQLPVLSELETKTALAGALGDGLDTAMEQIATAIEDHLFDTGLNGALGDQLADNRRRRLVGAGLQPCPHIFLNARRRGKSMALSIVDHLGIDM